MRPWQSAGALENRRERLSTPDRILARESHLTEYLDLLLLAPHRELFDIQVIIGTEQQVGLPVTRQHAREIYLNEVNTLPGFTAISMYPSLWRASGVDSQQLVAELVELARERHRERQALRTTGL